MGWAGALFFVHI